LFKYLINLSYKYRNSIVESRRDETNFQLVIITHDDKFAEKLGVRELSNFKYRVERCNNGHSKIIKLDHNNVDMNVSGLLYLVDCLFNFKISFE
jgi:hypothetical protein